MSRDALVVGINTYDHLKSLSASAVDAEAIAQRLEQYGEFKVTRLPAVKDKANNTIRIGQQTKVALTQLKKSIVQLFKPEGRHISDTALLYFSGHGLREGLGIEEGFLATSDVNPEDGKWGLSLQWLRRLLLESEVRQQIIILDCCYSGEIQNFAEADPGDKGKGRDRCFIAASRAYEVAYEEIDSKHSVLTNVLLKGLEPEQEQWVTNYALIDFLNQQGNSFPQRPIFSNSGEVINFTRRQTLNTLDSTAKPEQAICPYKGLAYFDCTQEDAKYFYGRTALTDQLLEKVRTSNILAILGASGSGKSSVVRAGLLYQLKRGQRLSDSNNWQIRILKPGEHPLESLARVFIDSELSDIERASQLASSEDLIAKGAVGLAQLINSANTNRVVLVVDQFEEVFTLCQNINERKEFFECLLGAVQKTANKLCLVLVMRADFFGKCAEQEYSGLVQQIQRNLVTVTPLLEKELKQAIVEPARLVGLEIEPELVEQMLKDVANAPGYLPLLQYTLTQMWNKRTDNCLRLNNYVKLGGVMGTLSQHATEVYESFSDDVQKEAVRHIFVSLTQFGEGTEDTRKRVLKENLINEKYAEDVINKVIQRLADEKLIVTSEMIDKSGASGRIAVVDVAHEALIRYWDLFRNWTKDDREERIQRQKIEAVLGLDDASFEEIETFRSINLFLTLAEEWQSHGKLKEYLIVGQRAADVEEILNRYNLSPLCKDFLKESLEYNQILGKKAVIRRKNEKRLFILSIIFGIFSFIVIPILGYSFYKLKIINESWREFLANKTEVDGSTKTSARARTIQKLIRNGESIANIDLSKTNFSDTSFDGADLRSANLSSVNLINARFKGANLRGANLANANLANANLEGTDLRDADLRDADLSNAVFNNDTALEGSLYNDSTRLPANFDSTQHKMKFTPKRMF